MVRRIIVIYILFLTAILLANSIHTSAETISNSIAVKGFINLENKHRTKTEQMFSLNGEWEFYWQQLLNPKKLKINRQPVYIQVPSSWKGQTINGEKLPNDGYGTYRLTVKVAREDIGKNKALYFTYIGSAYRLWIDGVEKNGVGVIGRSTNEELPKLNHNLIFFEPKQQLVELIIQVSNYSFREGGIIGEISYGETEVLIPFILKDVIHDIFIIGGFFFIGLFHLAIYSILKRELAFLFIGLIGIVAAGRKLLLSEYLVSMLFENNNWEIIVRLEYLIEVIGFMFLILLMKHLYSKEVRKFSLKIVYAITLLLSSYILLVPIRIFTETIFIHVIVMVIVLLYFVGYVGILAVIRKREGALINIIALMIIIVGIVNDTFYFMGVINTVPLKEYCGFLFFLAQAVIISYRYSLFLKKNKMLTTKLQQMNDTLEEKVFKRTIELHEKNEELFYLAATDELTGVFNRRHFLNKVSEHLEEINAKIALLLLDIDEFKQVNDMYGHLTGDQVLIEFSNILRNIIANKGLVGRMGGEEFAIFLDGVNEKQSLETAEYLRKRIETSKITIDENKQISVTASIGLAFIDKNETNFEQLYKNADKALYFSKETGKNKVTLAEPVY